MLYNQSLDWISLHKKNLNCYFPTTSVLQSYPDCFSMQLSYHILYIDSTIYHTVWLQEATILPSKLATSHMTDSILYLLPLI